MDTTTTTSWFGAIAMREGTQTESLREVENEFSSRTVRYSATLWIHSREE